MHSWDRHEPCNYEQLPAPISRDALNGKWAAVQVVFPVNWRDHFMINKGSVATADTPVMYPMPYTNNNNYNLICEKYGFKKGLNNIPSHLGKTGRGKSSHLHSHGGVQLPCRQRVARHLLPPCEILPLPVFPYRV
jgi:hypothetical protein